MSLESWTLVAPGLVVWTELIVAGRDVLWAVSLIAGSAVSRGRVGGGLAALVSRVRTEAPFKHM